MIRKEIWGIWNKLYGEKVNNHSKNLLQYPDYVRRLQLIGDKL